MHHICGPLHYTYACTCTRAQCPTYVHYVDLIPAADTEILFPERQGAWSGGSHSEYWQVFWPMTLNDGLSESFWLYEQNFRSTSLARKGETAQYNPSDLIRAKVKHSGAHASRYGTWNSRE